ncbi:MAG: NAD(+)/NADH kinase [Lachnospiraceae bacterium]|nr:NAD(+)/NADH kinase [Lachnospiraceae bacterium]
MKSFYIITNSTRDEDLAFTRQIEEFFRSKGLSFYTHIADVSTGKNYTDENKIPKDTDCVIVLGGDGTMIQAAHDTADLDLPLLGINLGRIGYLADVEKVNINESLTDLIEGRYKIEERMMISGEIITPGAPNHDKNRSLNDIIIHRGGEMRVVNYQVYINDKFLYDFWADGMIVSTPTGSTAYSMSAGGPIVEPMSEMIIITPICPHTVNSRSIVFSSKEKIRIGAGKHEVYACFDGHISVPMTEKDEILIMRSSKTTKLVRLKDDSFLTVLHDKFQ